MVLPDVGSKIGKEHVSVSVGKTVIGTAVDGTPEIIRDGVDGDLVEARNSSRLAEKMNYLIDDSKIRERFEM